MEEFAINTLDDLKDFAERLANEISPPAVLLLCGEMGSGKTTFVQNFARAHGVNLPVRSPSFIIHHEYNGINGEKIHHLDLYRLYNLIELNELRITDSLSDHSYILIEWADKFESELKDLFPNTYKYILYFDHNIEANSRKVKLEKI